MAWMSYADGRGRGWAVDPDGCAHIFRSNHYNRQLVARSRVVTTSQGLFLPTLTQVETNFSGIREATTQAAAANVRSIVSDAANDPRRFYEYLVHVREDGESAGTHYRDMSRRATRATAASIDSHVTGWENALAAARFVRDASAGVLMVGATALSGGAALAVGAAGTGITFTGNTQDNLAANQTMRQAMGNAAISTSVSVVTNILIPRGLSAVGRGMVGAGQQLSVGQNVVLGLITVQANIAGDMFKTALTADQNIGPEARAGVAATAGAGRRTRRHRDGQHAVRRMAADPRRARWRHHRGARGDFRDARFDQRRPSVCLGRPRGHGDVQPGRRTGHRPGTRPRPRLHPTAWNRRSRALRARGGDAAAVNGRAQPGSTGLPRFALK
ncbi:MAG: hypothetical protein IPO74_03610 [Thermomonas sp.]|nr:hypothetical protein [Thermomonas sp.]